MDSTLATFRGGMVVSDAMRHSLTVKPLLVPNQVTVLDLRSLMHERFDRHRSAISTLLERCYARIRRCAGVHRTDCIFEVPTFVPGLPLYDQATCTDAVVAHLARNGFTVSRSGLAGDPTLAISWSITPSPITQNDVVSNNNNNNNTGNAGSANAVGRRQTGLRSIAEFRPKRFYR